MTSYDEIVIRVEEEIMDLIPAYLENRRSDVGRLEQALEQEDFETVRDLGHSMKGSGGGFGMDRISEMGMELEEAGKAMDPDGAARALSDLREYLDRVTVLEE